MKYLLNRIEVYCLYFWEYLRFGEITALNNAFIYMLTGQSKAKAARIQTGMGIFETRARTLDFQYINYAYELSVKRFIEKEDFDVFLDIGACLGEFCIWLGKKGKRCYAFEPVKASFDMINKNIQLNQVEQSVTAFNFGLGAKHSLEYFELNETNPGANRKVEQPTTAALQFEINALDDVMDKLQLKLTDRILVKIDIEGMELPMLEGAKHFLQTYPNIVMIIEEKFSGEDNIRRGLSNIASFTFGQIDEYNIYARRC